MMPFINEAYTKKIGKIILKEIPFSHPIRGSKREEIQKKSTVFH